MPGMPGFRTRVAWLALGLWLGGLAAGPARGSEYFFALVFGSQDHPKHLRHTHTWATFVRAVGDGPDLNAYQLHVHTISWYPATRRVRVLALEPERGVNLTLEETLARWRAEEASVRAQLATAAGIASPDEVADRSGMEILAAIFAGELPRPPMGDTLEFVPIRFDVGSAVFQARPQWKHYNPLGTVHGGWFATLLDSAMGCAVHSTLPAGKSYTTLELKLNVVRALTDDVPLVRAEGRLIHAGRRVATADGRLVGPDGRLYAHATSTCLIIDA